MFLAFSDYIAGMLLHRGFEILDRFPNRNKPNCMVYVFEDSPELRDAFATILEERANAKVR